MTDPPTSTVRIVFEASVRDRSWAKAFREFNSMSMYEMLRAYKGLGEPEKRLFWDQRNGHTPGRPSQGCMRSTRDVPHTSVGERERMGYAVAVVDTQMMPDGQTPGDLEQTGQVEDAREFLAPVPAKLAALDFAKVKAEWPAGTVEQVKQRIGGKIAADSTITNTCAIRMSRVLNYNGFQLPPPSQAMTTQSGSDRLWYSRYQKQLTAWLETTIGPPSLVVRSATSSDGGRRVPRERLRSLQGFIGFDIRSWADATGHIDIWDGARFGTEPEAQHDYFSLAESVKFWRVPTWKRQSP
jgi:hypothetical protein